MYKPHIAWSDSKRDDIIQFDPDKDMEELEKNFKVGKSATATAMKTRILELVKKYWDCFASDGARRPILGYEFGIDTGQSKPVCKYRYNHFNTV